MTAPGSPVPWRVESDRQIVSICDADNWGVAILDGLLERRHADAALIVSAVNAHAELQAEIERLREDESASAAMEVALTIKWESAEARLTEAQAEIARLKGGDFTEPEHDSRGTDNGVPVSAGVTHPATNTSSAESRVEGAISLIRDFRDHKNAEQLARLRYRAHDFLASAVVPTQEKEPDKALTRTGETDVVSGNPHVPQGRTESHS